MQINKLKQALLGSEEDKKVDEAKRTTQEPQVYPPLPNDALQEAVRSEKPIGLLMQKQDEEQEPAPENLYNVGTVAEILRYLTVPDGTHHVICQGVRRFKAQEFLGGYPFLVARIESHEEVDNESKDIEARAITLKQKALDMLSQAKQAPVELVNAIHTINSPSMLADLVASYLISKPEENSKYWNSLIYKYALTRFWVCLTTKLKY